MSGTPSVIDADGHIVEPDACFRDFLPQKYASYAPRIVQFDDHFRYVCGDRISFRIHARPETVGAPGQTAHVTGAPVVARGADDPVGRLLDMDIDLIERAALYEGVGGGNPGSKSDSDLNQAGSCCPKTEHPVPERDTSRL